MKCKKTIGLLLAAVMTCTLAGCSSGGEASSAQPQTESASAVNPITGEFGYDESAVNLRPMAVVVSNIKMANPQDGVTSADMLYESLAEGGITRMMAVFSNYKKMPQVGPIRSARIYFVKFAMGMDAQYVHFGGSTTAKGLIASEKLDAELSKSANVAIIYVSIDKNPDNWQKGLQKIKVGKYHYRAGKVTAEAIKSCFDSSSVPRYGIINKIGLLYSYDAPRPSENEKLKNIFLNDSLK